MIFNGLSKFDGKEQRTLKLTDFWSEQMHWYGPSGMQYRDFQLGGIPIGSDTIEAGAKQFKHRFTGTGMRWSRQGLNNALPFRDALLSDQFDACWLAICPR